MQLPWTVVFPYDKWDGAPRRDGYSHREYFVRLILVARPAVLQDKGSWNVAEAVIYFQISFTNKVLSAYSLMICYNKKQQLTFRYFCKISTNRC